MNNDHSAAAQRFRARMVQRAIQQNIPMLARSLHAYAQAEGVTWPELAASIGCGEDELNRVALCNPPRRDRFLEDAQAIAAGRADFALLLPLLRRLQILEAFSADRAAETRAAYADEGQTLLAARDRELTETETKTDADSNSDNSNHESGA